MHAAERFNRGAGTGIRGVYNPFHYEIRCSRKDDYPTFQHEYAHHIQNVTTIQGAERLQAFLQIAANLSKLCANSETVSVPMWKPTLNLVNPEGFVGEQLRNVFGHWNEIIYWDQQVPYLGLNEPEALLKMHAVSGNHPVLLYEFDFFGDGHETWIPLFVQEGVSSSLTGFPIGGLSIGEGISRSLERMAAKDGRYEEPVPLTADSFVYLVWPSLMRSIFGRDCGDFASVLMGDLVLSFSTPHVAASQVILDCVLWRQDFKGKVCEIAIRELYSEFADRYADQTAFAMQTEIESLRELKERAQNQFEVFRDVIDWQVDNLLLAFEKRRQAPDYFATALLKACDQPRWLRHILEDFPPLQVQYADEETPQTDTERFNRLIFLQKLYRLFEFLSYGVDRSRDDFGLAKFGLELGVERISAERFRLRQQEIASGETNHEGKLLEVLKMRETVFEVMESV